MKWRQLETAKQAAAPRLLLYCAWPYPQELCCSSPPTLEQHNLGLSRKYELPSKASLAEGPNGKMKQTKHPYMALRLLSQTAAAYQRYAAVDRIVYVVDR